MANLRYRRNAARGMAVIWLVRAARIAAGRCCSTAQRPAVWRARSTSISAPTQSKPRCPAVLLASARVYGGPLARGRRCRARTHGHLRELDRTLDDLTCVARRPTHPGRLAMLPNFLASIWRIARPARTRTCLRLAKSGGAVSRRAGGRTGPPARCPFCAKARAGRTAGRTRTSGRVRLTACSAPPRVGAGGQGHSEREKGHQRGDEAPGANQFRFVACRDPQRGVLESRDPTPGLSIGAAALAIFRHKNRGYGPLLAGRRLGCRAIPLAHSAEFKASPGKTTATAGERPKATRHAADALESATCICALDHMHALPDPGRAKPVHRRILYGIGRCGSTPARRSIRRETSATGGLVPSHGDHQSTTPWCVWRGFASRIRGRGRAILAYRGIIPPPTVTRSALDRRPRAAVEGIDEDGVEFRPITRTSKEGVLAGGFPIVATVRRIAVGMATSIPPHNEAELCDAARIDRQARRQVESLLNGSRVLMSERRHLVVPIKRAEATGPARVVSAPAPSGPGRGARGTWVSSSPRSVDGAESRLVEKMPNSEREKLPRSAK